VRSRERRLSAFQNGTTWKIIIESPLAGTPDAGQLSYSIARENLQIRDRLWGHAELQVSPRIGTHPWDRG